jgi:hypothetical protein
MPSDGVTERRGVALLEVVLALAIFFITATFVLDGLNASLRSVQRAELEAQAADISATVLSEVQMGLRQIRNEPPTPYDEELYPGWTWELVVTGVEDLPDLPLLKRVELVVRNASVGVVHRLTQLVWDDLAEETQTIQ